MKADPNSVWISIARDVWSTNRDPMGPWADVSNRAAKRRCEALNASGSWLEEAGYKAYVVGEFRLAKRGAQ